jgi:N-acyl homoserine lactone hydrolase
MWSYSRKPPCWCRGPNTSGQPHPASGASSLSIRSPSSKAIIATPGHTPGHQSLLVKLPKSGALVLSGDAVHFQSNWDNRRVPSGNSDKDQTLASMQRIADVLAKEKAQLWINHDKAQRDSLKMAPDFYD